MQALEKSIERLRTTCRGRAARRRHHRGRARRASSPAAGAGRPGRTVCPRGQGAARVVGGDERRPGAGRRSRRRSLLRVRPSASTADSRTRPSSRPAACSASSEVYAAGGAGAIAMFAYGYRRRRPTAAARRSTWSPARRTSTASRRSGCCAGSSASTPRQVRPRSRSWPTPAADAAFVAADLISQAEHDTAAASVLVTDSADLAAAVEASAGRPGRDRPSTPTGCAQALAGPQSAIVLVDDLDQGLDVVNAYAAEHLEIHTVDARGPRRRGSATRARSSSGRTPRSRSATTAPGPTTCSRPAAARATRRVCRCARSSRPCRSSTTRAMRWLSWPARSRRWPRPKICLRTATPSAIRCRCADDRHAFRCGPSCAANSRTALRSSTCRSGSTSTRTRTAPRPRSCAASPTPSRRPPVELNRYPDREATALREALAGYLGHGLDRRPGLGGQRVQRGDAADPAGVRRTRAHCGLVRSDVLDVPRVRPRHGDTLGRRPPRRRLRDRPRRGDSPLIDREQPTVVFLASPNNPTGTALDLDTVKAVCAAAPGVVVVDEAYAEFRRAARRRR